MQIVGLKAGSRVTLAGGMVLQGASSAPIAASEGSRGDSGAARGPALAGKLVFCFPQSALPLVLLPQDVLLPLPEVLQGMVYFAVEAKKLWLNARTGCAWLDSCFLLFWECLGRCPRGSLTC